MITEEQKKRLTSDFYNYFELPILASDDWQVLNNCLKILGNGFTIQYTNSAQHLGIYLLLTKEMNEIINQYDWNENETKFYSKLSNTFERKLK